MGWASGSDIMDVLVKSLKKNVLDPEARRAVYRDAIRAFEKHDCDTLDECRGVDAVFDAALSRWRR